MEVRVRLFGALREEVGSREITLELEPGACVTDLRRMLAGKYDSINRLADRLAVSVNLELVGPDELLHDGDEVALLPPVSGGAGAPRLCTLSDQPLDEGEVIARVAGADIGGVVSFVGTVRDHSRGRAIEYLDYEAYPDMAEREMQKICQETAQRWPGTRLAIAHRVGRLEIGELAVVVVAAAPHRGEAFDACRHAIDTLKVTVPIWKKEVATDGEYWVDDHA